MADYRNISGATFTLPDGRNVQNGETVKLDADTLAIPGVLQFIEAGGMEKSDPPAASMPSPEPVEMSREEIIDKLDELEWDGDKRGSTDKLRAALDELTGA